MSVEVLHPITLLQVIARVEILAVLLHPKSVGVGRIWFSKATKLLVQKLGSSPYFLLHSSWTNVCWMP
jgi:hypothetical protein